MIAPVVPPSALGTRDRRMTAPQAGPLAGRRPPPLPALPAARAVTAVYGVVAMRDRGRIVDHVVLGALGWTAGTRLDINDDRALARIVTGPVSIAFTGRS